MWQWWEDLVAKLGAPHGSKSCYRFVRHFRVSEQALTWVLARPSSELLAFADLMLRLDGDPFMHSNPVLQPNAVPGMRFAPFDAHQAVLVWNAAENSVYIVLCH